MNIIPIDTLELEELKIYTRYNEPQLLHMFEPGSGALIAESPDVIRRALARGCEPISFLVEDRYLTTDAIKMIEPFPDVPVYSAPPSVIRQQRGFQVTRGFLSWMRRPSMPTPDDLIESSQKIVLLENVENPSNLGSIFRNAAAFGTDSILITADSTDPFYRRAARVSMGAVFQIPWIKIDSAAPVAQLKKAGFTIISMALSDTATHINDPALDVPGKKAIVFGNERNGISAELLQQSDHTVIIPMQNGVDSLNVASASAVALYRFFGGWQASFSTPEN